MAKRSALRCQHYGRVEVEMTMWKDPEPRYVITCRGCDLHEVVFECQSCGTKNPDPMTCCLDPEESDELGGFRDHFQCKF